MVAEVGNILPNVVLQWSTEEDSGDFSTNDFFSNKKVVIFAVPGAFTSTCSKLHVPSYLKHYEKIKLKKVDAILCISVNDQSVMQAWAKNQKTEDKIIMISDGNAEFTRLLGLEVDLSQFKMGIRSKRYSMLVDNGCIKFINIEKNRGIELTGAENMLNQL